MALTFTTNGDARANLGPSCIIQQCNLQPAAADYPTGGYPVNPQLWGLGDIRGLIIMAYTGTAVNYEWKFVALPANQVTYTLAGYLQVYALSTGAQVAAGTDLSGGTVKVVAFGF